MSLSTSILRGVAAILLATSATVASAQSAWDSGTWRFGASLYAYLPTIGGTLNFPNRSGSGSVRVDADTLLDSLEFAFMGNLDVHNGRWGVFTDVMYLDVSGSTSQTRDFQVGGANVPASVTGNLDLDLKGTVWTLAGEYRVASTRELTVDALAGARLIDIRPKLGWSLAGDLATIPVEGRGGNIEIKAQNWDGIVGLKGRYAFGDGYKWHVPFYADVGTGESHLTWQAAAGLGYSFSWGDAVALWRYLGYEMKSDQPVDDINFSGPMLGVTFRW
jgi:hypothetical protein